MLVVIAIIALLLSILAPSLTKAKDQARKSMCAANLHSLHLTTEMYINTFNGYMPAVSCHGSDNACQEKHRGFMTQMQAFERGEYHKDPKNNIVPFFICPADRDPGHHPRAWDTRSISYGPYSYVLSAPFRDENKYTKEDRKKRAVPVHRIKPRYRPFEPDDTVLYGETGTTYGRQIQFTGKINFDAHKWDKARTPILKYGTLIKWNHMFRHDEDQGANYLMFDGGVRSVQHYDEVHSWHTIASKAGYWSYWTQKY